MFGEAARPPGAPDALTALAALAVLTAP
jgi:hypothetical protein